MAAGELQQTALFSAIFVAGRLAKSLRASHPLRAIQLRVITAGQQGHVGPWRARQQGTALIEGKGIDAQTISFLRPRRLAGLGSSRATPSSIVQSPFFLWMERGL